MTPAWVSMGGSLDAGKAGTLGAYALTDAYCGYLPAAQAALGYSEQGTHGCLAGGPERHTNSSSWGWMSPKKS